MHRAGKVSKPMMGAIAAGIGLTAVAGIMGAQKVKKVQKMKRAMHPMMTLKEEFASEAGIMAKKAGDTLIKVGKTMNKMAR